MSCMRFSSREGAVEEGSISGGVEEMKDRRLWVIGRGNIWGPVEEISSNNGWHSVLSGGKERKIRSGRLTHSAKYAAQTLIQEAEIEIYRLQGVVLHLRHDAWLWDLLDDKEIRERREKK